MIDFVKRLIQQGKLSWEQVVFMDFSLHTGETIDPFQLLESYHSKYPNSQPLFVLDEVQDIANMQELILFLYNQNYKVFISGSNSKLLSSELSTHFRGRIIEYQVYPLTYPELLSFRDISTDQPFASRERGMLKNLYHNVFTFGNFPEVVLADHEFAQRETIKSYYNVLLYRDLLERYHLENEVAVQYLLKSLTLSFTKDVNIHKIYNNLKSQNVKI
jgi:predicted AAA+ superfamily ATPase